jgi:hypothetical protein
MTVMQKVKIGHWVNLYRKKRTPADTGVRIRDASLDAFRFSAAGDYTSLRPILL